MNGKRSMLGQAVEEASWQNAGNLYNKFELGDNKIEKFILYMWGYGGPNLANITALTDNPETTVEQILDDSAITAAIRNGIPAIIRFLTKPTNLNHLLDLALTDIVPDTKSPAKTTRNAVQVLTTSTSSLMNAIMKVPDYTAYISHFIETDYAKLPKPCGHYYRIIESLFRFTNGNIPDQNFVPKLKEFLIKNMSCMALRELFVALVTDWTKTFNADSNLFTEVAKASNGPNGFYSITALKAIANTKNSFQKLMRNEDTIRAILDVAVNPEVRPIVSIEAFHLVEKLIENEDKSGPIYEVTKEVSEKYDFSIERPAAVTAAALGVLNVLNEDLIEHIFEPSPLSYLSKGVLRSIGTFSRSPDFNDFVANTELLPKIYTAFGENAEEETKRNLSLRYVLELCCIIGNSTVERDDMWTDFYKDSILPRLAAYNKPFGGNPPNTNFASESSEDSSESSSESESDSTSSEEEILSSDSSSSDEIPPNASKDSSSDDDAYKIQRSFLDSSTSSDEEESEQDSNELILIAPTDDKAEEEAKKEAEEKVKEEEKNDEKEEVPAVEEEKKEEPAPETPAPAPAAEEEPAAAE